MYAYGMKNPTIATILNFIPGLGYLYVGGKRKLFGLLILTSFVVSAVASTFDPLYTDMSAEFRSLDIAYVLSLVLMTAAFMYDAYVAATEANKKPAPKKRK